MKGKKERKPASYFLSDDGLEVTDDYELFWCLICGRREDEDDNDGMIFPSNSNELTAPETFLCSNCSNRIYPSS